ncbi:hypothetical protein GGI42DRAFT_304584 [Trichoderma sp. SZMC 28013]
MLLCMLASGAEVTVVCGRSHLHCVIPDKTYIIWCYIRQFHPLSTPHHESSNLCHRQLAVVMPCHLVISPKYECLWLAYPEGFDPCMLSKRNSIGHQCPCLILMSSLLMILLAEHLSFKRVFEPNNHQQVDVVESSTSVLRMLHNLSGSQCLAGCMCSVPCA